MQDSKNKSVAIIGGGASGLICAIALKQMMKDLKVTIFEYQNRVGKKILQTGNGKCNLTNLNIDNLDDNDYNNYFCHNILKKFNASDTIKFFNDLGLMVRKDEEGRVYPYSEKASTVLDVLLKKLNELNIEVITDIEITDVLNFDDYSIYSKDLRLYHYDYVIMATGGASGINFENRGYDILKSLNHEIIPISPALVALTTVEKTKSLSGIRLKCMVRMLQDESPVKELTGEVLFKDDGLSGIAIFDISRYFDKSKRCCVELDLYPEKKQLDINEEDLIGYFPKMINQDIINRSKKENKDIGYIIKHYRFNIKSTYGFSNSQITKGGVKTTSVNPFTCESLVNKRLYIIGEVLDVDGKCGGYNLQFAFASAVCCAKDIIKQIEEGENYEFTE